MSVLSRISTHTIPAQRGAERPAGAADGASAPAADGSRTSLALAGLAVVLAAAIGTTAYVLVDDPAAPAAPLTTTPATIVDPPFDGEAARDAAAASRHETSTAGGQGSDVPRRGGLSR